MKILQWKPIELGGCLIIILSRWQFREQTLPSKPPLWIILSLCLPEWRVEDAGVDTHLHWPSSPTLPRGHVIQDLFPLTVLHPHHAGVVDKVKPNLLTTSFTLDFSSLLFVLWHGVSFGCKKFMASDCRSYKLPERTKRESPKVPCQEGKNPCVSKIKVPPCPRRPRVQTERSPTTSARQRIHDGTGRSRDRPVTY